MSRGRRHGNAREIWRPVVEKAGAPTGIGMHELRHYYASLLIRYGESIKAVQRRLGHATAAETLDTYSHLRPDSDDRTRDPTCLVLACPTRAPSSSQGDIHAGHQLGADELACKPDPVHRAPCGAPAGGHPSRPAVAGRL